MKSNNFIHWLKGFLTGKEKLSQEELNVLLGELNKVTEEITLEPFRPLVPSPNLDWENPWIGTPLNPTCKYPDDCGMPTVWCGTSPPICGKCGNKGSNLDIRYSMDNHSSLDTITSQKGENID